MTPDERKNALKRGACRKAAKRVKRSPTYITAVLHDRVQPRTPVGERTLKRARAALAEAMGKTVEDVFGTVAA